MSEIPSDIDPLGAGHRTVPNVAPPSGYEWTLDPFEFDGVKRYLLPIKATNWLEVDLQVDKFSFTATAHIIGGCTSTVNGGRCSVYVSAAGNTIASYGDVTPSATGMLGSDGVAHVSMHPELQTVRTYGRTDSYTAKWTQGNQTIQLGIGARRRNGVGWDNTVSPPIARDGKLYWLTYTTVNGTGNVHPCRNTATGAIGLAHFSNTATSATLLTTS